jgi:hypothetical protein
VEQEIFTVVEVFLEQFQIEGIYFPYISLWNKLRNLYEIPRKRVGHLIKLVKEHVFVLKNDLVEKDHDFTASL